MSQIGIKALKVLGGAETLNDTTAQLSEAWLTKIKKINQVADNMDSSNGVVKAKKITPVKQQKQSQPIAEQRERQVPITEILAKTKTEKLGINKRQVSPDEIMALLSGNKPQPQIPVMENKKIETQYQEFINEAKQIKNESGYEESLPLSVNESDIRQMVTEEVTRILFKEIFSKNRLKSLMESVFQDVIKEKAKEILFETLKRRKAQGL
jgi:hypothetical protein